MENILLRPKYMVTKIGVVGTELSPTMKATDPDDVDSPFVLMPRKDPAAFAAMIQYARYCESGLAAEIGQWLKKIASEPPRYGTQGARNSVYLRTKAVHLGVL